MMIADGDLLEPPGFVDTSTTVSSAHANNSAAEKSILYLRDWPHTTTRSTPMTLPKAIKNTTSSNMQIFTSYGLRCSNRRLRKLQEKHGKISK